MEKGVLVKATSTLRVMSYGKWSDRFGGADQPYEFVDLYDQATGGMFTWSLDSEIGEDRPGLNSECEVEFELEKRAAPALTTVKKGERKGETMEYVQEKLKVKVTSLRKLSQAEAAKAAAA